MTAVLAGAPVRLTRHAMRRYRERICPDADDREAAVVLRDATRRMWRADERTHNGECLWCVDRPDMRLVTKHDPAMGMILVTVLAPEQMWDEPAEETPAAPAPAPPPSIKPPKLTKARLGAMGMSRKEAEQAAAEKRRRERAERHAALVAQAAREAARAKAARAIQHQAMLQRHAERKERERAEGITQARERRRALAEANHERNRALGLPTKSERRAARAAGPPQCHGVNALVCVNLLDGYESAWRREEDGAGLCRECDAALDRDHAALSAATAEAAEWFTKL